MYNETTLIGRLTREPEITITTSNAKVAKLSIASSVNSKHGKYTVWFTVNVWKGAAEFAEKYLHTGDLVHITGSLIPDFDTGNPPVFQKRNGEYASQYVLRGRVLTLLHRKQNISIDEDDDFLGEKEFDDIAF